MNVPKRKLIKNIPTSSESGHPVLVLDCIICVPRNCTETELLFSFYVYHVRLQELPSTILIYLNLFLLMGD